MKVTLTTRNRIRILVLIMVWCVSGMVCTAAAGSKVALVIGNASYNNFDGLNSPIRDANAVAAKLPQLGFQLVGNKAHINVERKKMLELLQSMSNALRLSDPSSMAVVYYSGHGASFDDDNWLIPVDDRNITHREDLLAHAIGTKTVLSYLPPETGLTVVILDACRDYSLKSRRDVKTKSSQTTKGLVRIEPPTKVAIVYAAKEGQVAYDGQLDGYSPFTEALLDKIDQPGKSVLRVLSETAKAVEEKTKYMDHGSQQPFLSETQLSGMNLDREFFVECPPDAHNCGVIIKKSEHEKAFDNAKKIGSILAFNSVVKGFPDSSSANMAQQHISQLTSEHFSLPPEGRNRVLNLQQVKWCLRQEAWLTALHGPATRDVRINAIHKARRIDYLNRCGSYRSNRSDLLAARAWIDQHSQWIVDNLPKW